MAAIIKANVPGSRIPPSYQTQGAGQAAGAAAGAAQYANPPQYPGAAPKSDNRTLFWVVVVAAALILSPLWLSVLGTVLGILAAVAITGAALAFSGVAMVIAGIVVVVKGFLTLWTGVGTALLVAGLGVQADSMDLSADAGSVDVSGTVNGEAKIEVNAGSVTLRIPRPEQCGYAMECNMGQVELFGDVSSSLYKRVVENEDLRPFFDLEVNTGKAAVRADDTL